MRDFNDQVNNMSNPSSRRGIFKEGVKGKFLTGKQPVIFRIQPAYDYQPAGADGVVPDPHPDSWVPCRYNDGRLTHWGTIVKLARFIGHGNGRGSNRRDFVSPLTWGEACPLAMMYSAAANYPEWSYLVEEIVGPDGKRTQGPALSSPSDFLAVNAVEASGAARTDNIVGVMTKSASDGLINPNVNSLVHFRSNIDPAYAAQNPMATWALGDITHPTTGAMFVIAKGTDRGEFSAYQISASTDSSGRLRPMALTREQLNARYNLMKLETVFEIKTAEAIVKELLDVFNLRSPTGVHEYEFLRLVFSDRYEIPAVAKSSGPSTTVQGWGAPPAAAATAPGSWAPPAAGNPAPAPVPGAWAPPAAPAAPTAPAPGTWAPPAAGNPAAPTAPAPAGWAPPVAGAPAPAAPAPGAWAPPVAGAPVAGGWSLPAPGNPNAGPAEDNLNMGPSAPPPSSQAPGVGAAAAAAAGAETWGGKEAFLANVRSKSK